MSNHFIFLPRHDEELDQLVNEVMDKDLILRAIIGEAEMLIFLSVLLPERYQSMIFLLFVKIWPLLDYITYLVIFYYADQFEAELIVRLLYAGQWRRTRWPSMAAAIPKLSIVLL